MPESNEMIIDGNIVKGHRRMSDINKNGRVRMSENSLFYKRTEKTGPQICHNHVFSELWKLSKDLQKAKDCLFKEDY